VNSPQMAQKRAKKTLNDPKSKERYPDTNRRKNYHKKLKKRTENINENLTMPFDFLALILCHLWAVHSEGRSVRQGGENSPFLL